MRLSVPFRVEVEEDPHYKSIVEYLRTGEVHLPGPMSEDVCKQWQRSIRFRMMSSITRTLMES